jgi:RHS repeat-associated protein
MQVSYSHQKKSNYVFKLPFGEEVTRANYSSDGIRQKFTGYERDNETGLDFAQARMYSSKLGRFSTTDPILMTESRKFNPQEINLYVYVRNNPLSLIDPFGEEIDFAGKNKKEREANKEYYDNYVKYVNSLADDNPDKARLQATIKQLEESSVTYVINVTTNIGSGGEVEGKVEPDENGNKIMVNIRNLGNKHEEWSMNSRFAHELKHAQQFDNGEIGFYKDSKSGNWFVTQGSYDSFDEVNAYKDSVAIGVTNGSDNMNPKLRGIITGIRDAKGDRNKELDAYKTYRNLDDKKVIRQNNIVRYPDKSAGWQRFNAPNGNLVVICNNGCSKK